MDTRNNPPEHLPSVDDSVWANTNDYGYVHPDVSETNPLDKLRAKLARPKPPHFISHQVSAATHITGVTRDQRVTLILTNNHGCAAITMRQTLPLEEPFTYDCWCGKKMLWELPEFYTDVKAGYTITADGVLFSTWSAMQTPS